MTATTDIRVRRELRFLSRILRTASDAQRALAAAVLSHDAYCIAAERVLALSELLGRVGSEPEVSSPLAWRLLELRDRLDAHLLASEVLEEGPGDGRVAAVEMLRRGIDSLETEVRHLT